MLKKSFTLIEVLIFVTLISLIFIALSYLITYSLHTTKINEHKILATHYAEELREWLRGEKEADWLSFVNDRMGTWCFNNKTLSWGNNFGQCSSYNLDNIFKRQVTLEKNADTTQVEVRIIVEWQELNNIYKVPINTIFSIWE